MCPGRRRRGRRRRGEFRRSWPRRCLRRRLRRRDSLRLRPRGWRRSRSLLRRPRRRGGLCRGSALLRRGHGRDLGYAGRRFNPGRLILAHSKGTGRDRRFIGCVDRQTNATQGKKSDHRSKISHTPGPRLRHGYCQLTISASSPSPPGDPSLPYEKRSYSP